MHNPLSVLLVLGLGALAGFAAGYSKAREKFCEALIIATANAAEKEKN